MITCSPFTPLTRPPFLLVVQYQGIAVADAVYAYFTMCAVNQRQLIKLRSFHRLTIYSTNGALAFEVMAVVAVTITITGHIHSHQRTVQVLLLIDVVSLCAFASAAVDACAFILFIMIVKMEVGRETHCIHWCSLQYGRRDIVYFRRGTASGRRGDGR